VTAHHLLLTTYTTQARFNTEAFVQSHGDRTINEVVVLYTPTAEIMRPVGQDFESMPGMKKTFLFMPVREGVTLQREWACWCGSCMQASAPGEGTMDSSYRCVDCASADAEGCDWRETSIERSDAAGVANAKARTRQTSRSLRDQLVAHFAKSDCAVWVAVQNRGEVDPDRYWVGRATRIEKTYATAGSVAGTGGRVRYDVGDVEIEIEWFQRDISGGDERRIFTAWKRVVDADGKVVDAGPVEGHKYTFNSTELRMINVEMQLVPPVGGTPLEVVRCGSTRPAAQAARQNWQGIVRRVQTVRADPPEALWEIPGGNERLILDRCS
jgi:hypothetical protein